MKIGILELVIFALALWRVSSLIVSERGPFYIFERIRERVGVHHAERGEIVEIDNTPTAYLFTCLWCCSMLLAIPYGLLIYYFQDVMIWVSLPFALSALAIAFDGLAK